MEDAKAQRNAPHLGMGTKSLRSMISARSKWWLIPERFRSTGEASRKFGYGYRVEAFGGIVWSLSNIYTIPSGQPSSEYSCKLDMQMFQLPL